MEYLQPQDNEVHAPGKVCERCGAVITASEDARLRLDGQWVHEECPATSRRPAWRRVRGRQAAYGVWALRDLEIWIPPRAPHMGNQILTDGTGIREANKV